MSAIATVEPAVRHSLGKAFRKVRNVMQSQSDDENPIVRRLRELQQQYLQIKTKYDEVLKECARFQHADTSAAHDFFSNPSIESLHRLIDCRIKAGVAKEAGIILSKQLQKDLVGERFRLEFRDYRHALTRAAEFRLNAARKEFDSVLSQARKVLAKEGFDEEHLQKAPKVLSARD